MASALEIPQVEFYAGNAELALRLALDALPAVRAFNEMPSLADTLNNLSAYLISLSRFDEAEAYARELLVVSSEALFPTRVARALDKLAVLAAVRGPGALESHPESYERAARLFGFVGARLDDLDPYAPMLSINSNTNKHRQFYAERWIPINS